MDKAKTSSSVSPKDAKNDQLILACILGNAWKVRDIIKNPRISTPAQDQLVRDQIEHSLVTLVGTLITNEQASCPLCVAVIFNRPSVVKVLSNYPQFTTTARFPALILASRLGFTSIVDILLKKHRTFTSKTLYEALYQACLYGHTSTVRRLLQAPRTYPQNQNNSPLIAACSRGYATIVTLLVNSSRVDPSYPNNGPLQAAVANGRYRVVAALLYSGRVDPSLMNGSALQLATRLKDEKTIRVLLRDFRLAPHIDGILGQHLSTPEFSSEIAALLYVHTPSTHIVGSPRHYRVIQNLRLCKQGTFVIHPNHFYTFELIEQLLRCQVRMGQFDTGLLRMFLETAGIWTIEEALDTLNFVVSRCCFANNQEWLRIIIGVLTRRISEVQLSNIILNQQRSMNLDLANLLMIVPAYIEIKVLCTVCGATDVLPYIRELQMRTLIDDYKE